MATLKMTCNCWVADQSEEDRYCIRYGAHATTCPVYRESLDPVDRANDEELCEHYSTGEHCNGEDCRDVCECSCDPCLDENVVAV